MESLTACEEPEPVYNIEVEGDHVYRVGEQGLLVHNASAPVPTPLTPALMKEFQSLAAYRKELGLPLAGSSNDKDTLAKLIINGKMFWGISIRAGGLTREQLKAYGDLAACCNPHGKGPTQAVREHAEADTIFQAFDKNITAQTAVMYVDRPLCDWCNASLRNVLCLVGLKTLTWIGPNDSGTGYVTITVTAP